MKRNLTKLLLLFVVLMVGGVHLKAQTDIAQYLTNADFASNTGWTAVTSNEFNDKGFGAIGTYKVRDEFSAATVDETHLATENCIGLECRWSNNYASYTQTSTQTLPAGTYLLSFDVENVNGGTKSANYENRFYVEVNGSSYYDGKTEWMNGKSSWTTHTILFTITEASTFKVSLGYGTGSNNLPWQETPALYVSHLKLKKYTDNSWMEDAAYPVDMRGYIKNWDFIGCGWHSIPEWSIANPNGNYGACGESKAEYWTGTASNGNFDYYQILTGLPNGKYSINALMWNSTNGEEGASVNGNAGVYGDNGTTMVFKGVTDDCDKDNPHEYTTDPIKITNNENLRIGVKNNGTMGARWFGVDYIKLTLVSTPLGTYNTALANAKKAAATTKTVSTTLLQTLNNVIATYGNVSTTDETALENAASALAEATDKVNSSINSYTILESGTLPDNSLTGWTCTTFVEGQDVRWQVNTWSNEGENDGTNMTKPFLENWTPSPNTLGVGEIYYELPGLNPGIYEFSALIRAYSEAGNEPTGASLFAMNREKEFSTGNAFEFVVNNNTIKGIYDNYTMTGEVGTDGIFRFGVKIKDGVNFNWMAFKNCHVRYVGAAIDAAAVEAKYAEVDITKLMNATTKTNLTNAYNTAIATPNLDNYEALAIVVEEAKSSVALYEKIGDRINTANTYMYNGLTGFDASSVSTKYNGGQYANDYNPDEIYREYAQLYNAQTVAAPGTDYTLGIVNPTFETGNTFGWTHGSSSDTGVKPNSNGTYTMTNCDRNYLFNTWSQGVPLTQTIENIPNGIYRLTVTVASGDDDKDAYIYATANDSREVIVCPKGTKGTGRDVSVKTLVSDGNITIGTVGGNDDGTFNAEGHWWYKADNFRLTYVNTVAGYIANLKNQITENDAKSQFETEANEATTVEAIDAAFQAAIRSQVKEGSDYTPIIINPSFETGNTNGWTYEPSNDHGAKHNDDETFTMSNCDGDFLFNIWSSGNAISQTITNLPNGLYKLKAVVATDADHSVLLTGNGSNKEIACTDKGTGIEGELTFAVTDGNAIIGAEGKDKCWYKVDNFRLEFVSEIETVDNVASLKFGAPEKPFILKLNDLQVLYVGMNDSIVAQEVNTTSAINLITQEETTMTTVEGILLKGAGSVNNAAFGRTISGQVYGTFDEATRTFTIETNAGNSITAQGNIEPYVASVSAEQAALTGNAYILAKVEVATITKKDADYYAVQGNNEVKIDLRLNEDLVLNDGDIVNSVKGITFLNEAGDASVLAPMTQDDIVPLLWNAENIDMGDNKDESDPIDLTTNDIKPRMKALQPGDVLNIRTKVLMASRGQRRTPGSNANVVIVKTEDGRDIFTIAIPAADEDGISTVEVPITADIQEEVNKHGMKIAVNGRNAQLVTVLNAKYPDTANTIWLGEGNDVTLGAIHFSDVRANDVLKADGDGATMTTGETALTSGQALTANEAAALQDNTMAVTGATKVTFTLGDDPRDDKAEAEQGETFAQGEKETAVNGMIMTFGGAEAEGAEYTFEEAYPPVNKFSGVTKGVNTFPVDNEDKAYDPEQKNLPTKGTYYVFEPTKDGQLNVTVDLEQGKKLFVTEDGEALKDFNGITKVNNNQISFPVEAMKTYYVFANETNLTYYGFTFKPTTDCENIAKDIATFKLLPEDNADGDTLLLKDAVVTYIKGDNVFVEDESGATVFYKTGIQFYVGQKLNGYIVGQNHKGEDNMPQLIKTDKTNYKTFKVTETVTPEAKEMAVGDAPKEQSLARFAKLTDARARKDGKGFRILTNKEKTESIRVEDRFNVFYELPEFIASIDGIIGIDKEGTFFFWPTSKEGVVEGAGLTDAEEDLLAEAQKLAEDREAVAVGKLDDAIELALTGVGTGLQAAVDEFKANNADTFVVEEDLTAKVGTSKESWTGATGNYSKNGINLVERYGDSAIGNKISQEVSVDNGTYRFEVYATSHNAWNNNASLQNDADDVAYVFGTSGESSIKTWITARRNSGMIDSEPEVFAVNGLEVNDGKLTMGLALAKAGQTEWHTIQIKSLEKVAVTTAKAAYAADKANMQTLIDEATTLAADEDKTVGKDELNAALAAAKVAQESIRLNIPEFENEMAKLRQAIETFNAPYELLAEAQKLAADRDAVAVGKLDDAIEVAQTGDFSGLQAAVDEFNKNNADNAKETYAKDKAEMEAFIDEAEELVANEDLVNDKDKLEEALLAAKTALVNNRLTVPEFKEELGKLDQAIADFKEANHIGGNYLATGKYVLKNVASGLYWGAGNNWGTRASLLDYSEYQTLTLKSNGTYQMESQVSNGGTKYYFNETDNNLYMDNENPTALTITPVELEGEETEEIVDFDGTFYHNWSEVSGTATDNGSANGGLKLNEDVKEGGAFWGNLTGAVPFLDYANLTDYSEIRIEGTPGATIRLMCNRLVNEGPIFEIKPTIPEDGKLTVKISDLMFLNGGAPCDFVALQSIKIPWGGATAQLKSIKLVKTTKAAGKVLYTIANGESYYGYAEENPNDKPYVKSTAILAKGLAANDENALWEVIPATTEALAAATMTKPMDATFLIKNPNFGRNNRYADAWKMEASNQNLCGGVNENKCAESWHATFTLSQTLTNLPKGVYKLTAQGFYGQDGSDNEHLPVFYANEATQTFPARTGTENSMDKASKSFADGLYVSEPVFLELAADGDITIGAKLEGNTSLWCIWDNFHLTYYGPDASIASLNNAAILAQLDELSKKAADLAKEVDFAGAKTALDNALTTAANVDKTDEAAIKAAIATLNEAIAEGETFNKAKNTLAKMKEVVDATNVYTEEAYNQYYGTWIAKYNDGTLTKADANALQDPSVTSGWRAQVTVDDLLMSSWDENVMNWDSYHVNTWSVEGDTDGSNFRVPFIEYWIGDGESLGEKTLTATMNGLEAGTYDVTAWVRVRMKNGGSAPAYGISLQANNGTAVDVAAGDQVGETQFYLKEFTAQGTVGADGVLNIKFNVAADNNISWLSFKNVKFTKDDTPIVIAHTWDFTKWSDATVANLKAEAAKVTVYADPDKEGNTMCTDNGALWSDHEKAEGKTCDTYAASKDNCFWSMDEESELTANGVAIAELKGLIFDASYAKSRSIAIAVNYPSTSLGTYNGASYLWLGGKGKTCFTIPAVKGGTVIKMGVESHKASEGRGVKLLVNDTELTDPEGNAVAAPKAYTEQTWQVPAGEAVNVVVKNTNGCHIYFIDAEQDEEALTSISNVENRFSPNDAIYNLRGQKVEGTLKPGLYIKNGRKVVIK